MQYAAPDDTAKPSGHLLQLAKSEKSSINTGGDGAEKLWLTEGLSRASIVAIVPSLGVQN